MEIDIATIGGYEEVGRQMTAVRAGDDIVVFDMGLNLSKVLIHDNVETERMHSLDLIDIDVSWMWPVLLRRYEILREEGPVWRGRSTYVGEVLHS